MLDPGRRPGTHLGGGLRDHGDGGVELCGDRFGIGGELEFVEEGPKPAVGAPCGELRPPRVERIGIVDDDQAGRPARSSRLVSIAT